MYTTCIFCQRSLGSNEVVEPFPVGRRLAFDEAKGRLWVVCRKCGRWNLTPLEERWEGVEECERLFRGTRLRTSTENIGLTRHPEGLELVRIGAPLRPEFAAWRYGDQFRRRWRRARRVTAGLVLLGGVRAASAALPIAAILGGAASGSMISWYLHRQLRSRAKLRTADGSLIKLRLPDAHVTRLRPAESEVGFGVQINKSGLLSGLLSEPVSSLLPARWSIRLSGLFRLDGIERRGKWLEGEEARRAATALFPILNHEGAGEGMIQMAVEDIEEAGHPSRFLTGIVPEEMAYVPSEDDAVDAGTMAPWTTLAFEMALHEEQERRALEGELRLLERAWKEAEELAAISDELLVPEGWEEFAREHRERRGGR